MDIQLTTDGLLQSLADQRAVRIGAATVDKPELARTRQVTLVLKQKYWIKHTATHPNQGFLRLTVYYLGSTVLLMECLQQPDCPILLCQEEIIDSVRKAIQSAIQVQKADLSRVIASKVAA